MKRLMANRKQKKAILIALAAPLMFSPAPSMAAAEVSEPVAAIARQAQTIVSVQRINPTTVDVVFSNNQRMTFDFYGDNIFRVFQDTNGGILRDPEAKPEADSGGQSSPSGFPTGHTGRKRASDHHDRKSQTPVGQINSFIESH